MTTRPETAAKLPASFKAPPLTNEMMVEMHDRMVCSRIVDEVTIKMNRSGQGFFWIGGPGEEVFGACLGYQVKKGHGPAYDFLHLHYRSNPIMMAMGADPVNTLRQMRATETDPFSGGRNFVNHYAIPEWNVVPVTPTIETQYAVAPGTAMVQKRFGSDGITIVNGGDAGSAEGDFATCLNWTTMPGRELPVLIIINHNGWGISTAANTVQSSPNLAQRAEPYGIPWAVVDGNDIQAAWEAIAKAMHYCRTERKPYCLQANVSRLYGHSSADGANRRDVEDPIERFEAYMIEHNIGTRAQFDAVWERWRAFMRDAHKQVLAEPLAPASTRDKFIFKEI